jgi:hypothetical protein
MKQIKRSKRRSPTISIFATCTNPIERKDLFYQALKSYRPLADEIVIVNGGDPIDMPEPKMWDIMVNHPWPEEFKWNFIGEQFQRGYEACSCDWVIRMDLDFILHELDYGVIRKKLFLNPQIHALSMTKLQFLLADRYNLKSRLNLILNKRKFGKHIRLNGGGDLCQATLHDKPLKRVMESGANVWNYDFLCKTKAIVKKDIGRFARAWDAQFGDRKLGGPDDDGAFDKFMTMQIGRFNRPQQIIPLHQHPKVMQNTLARLVPEQFGYNLWGHTDRATYFCD